MKTGGSVVGWIVVSVGMAGDGVFDVCDLDFEGCGCEVFFSPLDLESDTGALGGGMDG